MKSLYKKIQNYKYSIECIKEYNKLENSICEEEPIFSIWWYIQRQFPWGKYRDYMKSKVQQSLDKALASPNPGIQEFGKAIQKIFTTYYMYIF